MSTTTSPPQSAIEISPAYCCTIYFCGIICSTLLCLFVSVLLILHGHERCYLQLFTHSVSVSNSSTNANVSTADWSFGLVATSPVTNCKISLYTIKSRLLRGEEVVSESSPSSGFFGQFDASFRPDWTVTNLGFNKVVTKEVIGDVVWNVQLEIVAKMKTDGKFGNGDSISDSIFSSDVLHDLFLVVCRDIPVSFKADSSGNMIGSLLGNMRRCDYTTVFNSDLSNNSSYLN